MIIEWIDTDDICEINQKKKNPNHFDLKWFLRWVKKNISPSPRKQMIHVKFIQCNIESTGKFIANLSLDSVAHHAFTSINVEWWCCYCCESTLWFIFQFSNHTLISLDLTQYSRLFSSWFSVRIVQFCQS